MKKNMIAVLLSIVMAVGSVGGASVFAAETTAQEASEIEQEEAAEELEEVPEENEDADNGASSEENAEEESAQVAEEEPFLEEDEEPEDDSKIAEEQEESAANDVTAEMPPEEVEDDLVDISEISTDISEIEEPVVIEEEIITAKDNETMGDAVASGTCGDNLTWTLDEEGTLIISGTGPMRTSRYEYGQYSRIIPWDTTKIKTVIINDGATTIGMYAFYQCYNLSRVTIPDSVTIIGKEAFYDCSNLTSVANSNGVNSVSSIGDYAFYKCSSLTNVSISNSGNNLSEIGQYAFYGCSSLPSITIPDGVRSIGRYAFFDCNSLTSVTNSNNANSVISIENHAFSGCDILSNVTILDNVKSIGEYAFDHCWKLTSVSIPNCVTIGKSAFACCGLTSITIPNGVKRIEDSTFWACSQLTSVILPDSVEYLGDLAFADCRSLPSIKVPSGNLSGSLSKRVFEDCEKLVTVSLGDGVTGVSARNFWGCTSLREFVVSSGNPNYISKDGVLFNKDKTELIYYSRGLESANYSIPTSVTCIKEYAFYGQDYLENVSFPNGLNNIENRAFASCTNLQSVIVPGSVKSIGENAFAYCKSLVKVTIQDGVTSIGNHAFSDCTSLTEVTIPDSVASIGEVAFSGCTSLTEVTIPDNVTSIGRGAFEDCSNLSYAVIGKGVTSIGNRAFSGCKLLIINTENEYVIEYCKSNKIMCNEFEQFFIISQHTNDYKHNSLSYIITDGYLLYKLYDSVRASWGKQQQIKRLLKNQEEGGVCHGTSSLMCYAQQGLVDIKRINPDADYYSHLGDPAMDYEGNVNNNTVFRNMLVYYQLLQLSDDCSETKKVNKGGWYNNGTLTYRLNSFLTEFVDEVKEGARSKKPFLFSFDCGSKYIHSVVVCGYRWRSEDSTHIVYIYDLNDRFNYKEMEIPQNCNSFRFVDANGKVVHNTWKSIGYYGIDKFYKRNYIVNASSATSNQASYAANNQSSSTTTFCVSEGKEFRIENDKGEWLSYDGADYNGNMEVLDCYTSGMEDYVYWNITINSTSKLVLKDFEPECELIAQIDGHGYSVLTDNADSITIQSDGISAEGSDYRLEVAVQSDENIALEIETSARGTTTITGGGKQLAVNSTGGCSNTRAWIQNGAYTAEVRVNEDNSNSIDIDYNKTQIDISKCTLEINDSTLIYSGQKQTPVVTIKDGNYTLIEKRDYSVSGSNNTNPGTATITITGIGSYTGTITKTFLILPGKTTRGDMFNLANNVKVTWKEVPGAKYYKVYREGITDKKESQKEPVIVTDRLVGWDKQSGLTNGHAYRYKIVASLTGKGDSSGDSPLSYSKVMYRLKTVVIRSVKNTAPGKVTVKYDKTNSGDSYVLQYCERQDMVGAKTKVVLGANNTSYVIGGLKKGKTYYISIRVRKKVSGIDYYTTFGVPKKVTITK